MLENKKYPLKVLEFCLEVILHAFMSSVDFECLFLQNQLFEITLSGIPPECQTVWTQSRPKMHQQATLVSYFFQGKW